MPIQGGGHDGRGRGQVNAAVYMRAYEVYREVFGEEQALIVDDCRGGFSKAELVAFLYARSFPKEEWERRMGEAFAGMTI